RHGHPNGGRSRVVEDPGYSTIHERLKRTRGRAAEHACVDCGSQASQWSFCECTPEYSVKLDHGRALRCTTDLNAYEPRCRACHNAQGVAARRAQVTA
ncbi:hypothetical protein ACC848_38560, partial [Rhizobium johnstonii]